MSNLIGVGLFCLWTLICLWGSAYIISNTSTTVEILLVTTGVLVWIFGVSVLVEWVLPKLDEH